MVTPAQAAIHIHLPENINSKHVDALKEVVAQMQRPTPPAPQVAKLAPKPAQELEENRKKLSHYPRLAAVLDKLVKGLKAALLVVAYPAFFAGGIFLAFGLSQTLFILATSLSPAILLESQALVWLMLGGILYKLGQDLIGGNDLNTILGNMLYIPLPFLLRLAK